MKRLGAFLVATTLAGLFVVLPGMVVFALLSKTIMAVHELARTVMASLAGKQSDEAEFPFIFSALLVLVISFAIGLAARSRHGRATGRWLEETLFLRLPGYAAIRALIGGLGGGNRERAVKSGLLALGQDAHCFVFIIEDHGTSHFTVYIPGSPNAGSGSVQIVPQNRIRLLNLRTTDIVGVMHQGGIGSCKVLAKHRAATPNDNPIL